MLRKRLQHRCFSVNFVKFLRTYFLQKTLWRLCHFQIVVFKQWLRLVHSGQRSWRKMDTLKKSGKTWKIRKDCKRNWKFRKKSCNFNLRYTVFFFFFRILINFICNIFHCFHAVMSSQFQEMDIKVKHSKKLNDAEDRNFAWPILFHWQQEKLSCLMSH